MVKTVLLLRAHGDFMVALQAAVNSPFRQAHQLVASLHHKALYEALPQGLVPADLSIVFHDFGIKGPMLRAFTNRHFLAWDTVKELQALKIYCKNPRKVKIYPNSNGPLQQDFWVENSHRKWILESATGQRFQSIAGPDKVYEDFALFFGQDPVTVPALDLDKPLKVLILPSARIVRRNIPPQLVGALTESLLEKGHGVKTAYFNSVPALVVPPVSNFAQEGHAAQPLVFQDFKGLVQLIQAADFVYAPDSLPIHLCQFLNKPHAILYPPNGSHQFFTPFALTHHAHFDFDQDPKQMARVGKWTSA